MNIHGFQSWLMLRLTLIRFSRKPAPIRLYSKWCEKFLVFSKFERVIFDATMSLLVYVMNAMLCYSHQKSHTWPSQSSEMRFWLWGGGSKFPATHRDSPNRMWRWWRFVKAFSRLFGSPPTAPNVFRSYLLSVVAAKSKFESFFMTRVFSHDLGFLTLLKVCLSSLCCLKHRKVISCFLPFQVWTLYDISSSFGCPDLKGQIAQKSRKSIDLLLYIFLNNETFGFENYFSTPTSLNPCLGLSPTISGKWTIWIQFDIKIKNLWRNADVTFFSSILFHTVDCSFWSMHCFCFDRMDHHSSVTSSCRVHSTCQIRECIRVLPPTKWGGLRKTSPCSFMVGSHLFLDH